MNISFEREYGLKTRPKKFFNGKRDAASVETEQVVGKVPVGIPKQQNALQMQQTEQQMRLLRRPRVDLVPTKDDPVNLDLLKVEN